MVNSEFFLLPHEMDRKSDSDMYQSGKWQSSDEWSIPNPEI